MQPPPVVATSHGYTSRPGPNVTIPSSWHRGSVHAHPVHPQAAAYSAVLPGYSANHALYGAERERWAKQAYATPPAETISLEISAVREGGNKRKGGRGIPFGVRTNTDRPVDPFTHSRDLTCFRIYVRVRKILTLELMRQGLLRLLLKRSGQRFSPLLQDFHGANMNSLFVMGDGWIYRHIQRMSLIFTRNACSLLVKGHALQRSRLNSLCYRLLCR
jgi:hypothetical protein